MGNRSLDDFLDGTGTSETVGEGVDETDPVETAEGTPEAPDADVAVPTAEIEPADSTYVSRSGECESCGETVERRWRSDDGLVCPACKEW